MTHILDTKILTTDDVLLVPSLGILNSRSDAELHSFLYSAPMDRVTGYTMAKALLELGENAVICRNIPEAEWDFCIKEFAIRSPKKRGQVFFAISTCQKWLKTFFDKLIAFGIKQPINVAIDIAHGDMKIAHELAGYLQELGICKYIMSGSICTLEAARRCIAAGCTHLRVGVGPGSMCTTRLQTGCGYPQLSAVYKISQGLNPAKRNKIKIIADGGVRTPGDAVKYMAAGADAVMLGSRFSHALEAPGWFTEDYEPPPAGKVISFPRADPKPIYAKVFRGHASASFQEDHNKINACPEGTSTKIRWQGKTTESIVNEFRGGLSSAISYLGLTRSNQLGPDTVRMIKITPAATNEGKPHGV